MNQIPKDLKYLIFNYLEFGQIELLLDHKDWENQSLFKTLLLRDYKKEIEGNYIKEYFSHYVLDLETKILKLHSKEKTKEVKLLQDVVQLIQKSRLQELSDTFPEIYYNLSTALERSNQKISELQNPYMGEINQLVHKSKLYRIKYNIPMKYNIYKVEAKDASGCDLYLNCYGVYKLIHAEVSVLNFSDVVDLINSIFKTDYSFNDILNFYN